MVRIPIEDAVELLEMEGYEINSFPEGLIIEVPETFTPTDLYEIIQDVMEMESNEPQRLPTPEELFGEKWHQMDNYAKSKAMETLHVGVSDRAKYLYKTYREKDRITQRDLQTLANEIFGSLGIPQIPIDFSGTQPATMKTSEYTNRVRTTRKTYGRYYRGFSGGKKIRIYKYTARKHKEITPKVAIDTLLHEIMHHYDYEKLGLTNSIHSSGFYKRISHLKQLLSE